MALKLNNAALKPNALRLARSASKPMKPVVIRPDFTLSWVTLSAGATPTSDQFITVPRRSFLVAIDFAAGWSLQASAPADKRGSISVDLLPNLDALTTGAIKDSRIAAVMAAARSNASMEQSGSLNKFVDGMRLACKPGQPIYIQAFTSSTMTIYGFTTLWFVNDVA